MTQDRKPSEWAFETVEVIEVMTGGAFNEGETELAAAALEAAANREAVAPAVRELAQALHACRTESQDGCFRALYRASNRIGTINRIANEALKPYRHLLESGE